MLDQQDPRARLARGPDESVRHKRSSRRIQLGRGLVEDQVYGPQREDRRKRHELRLPARQLRRVARRKPFDTHGPKRPPDPLDDFAARQPQVARPERDFLEDRRRGVGQLRRRVLEQQAAALCELEWSESGGVYSVDADRSLEPSADNGRGHPRRHEAEGRLARVVGSGDTENAAGFDVQVHVPQYRPAGA